MKFLNVFMKTLLLMCAGLFSLSSYASTEEQESIKVGVTASLTGAYSQQGKSLLQGLQMWADDINARGALLGRSVEIVYYDDASDPQTSAAMYEKLITEDNVELLVGPYASNVTMEASTVAEAHSFPMVSGTSAATAIWNRGYKNIFQVDVPAPSYMEKGLELTEAKSVGIVFQDNLFTREVAEGAKKKAEALGIDVRVFESYPREQTDFSSLVSKLKETDAELLLGASYFDDAVALVREAKSQNYNPLAFAFTSGTSVRAFGKELGKDAENIVGFTPWIRAARKPMAYDFNFRYRRIYGAAADSNAAGGYAAGEVLEAAVRLAKSTNKEAVRSQLANMEIVTLMGLYNVDEKGRQIGKEMFIIQWQKGRRVLILPPNLAEAPPVPMQRWDER